MIKSPISFRLLSCTFICGISLLNSSCSSGTRVSWDPFNRAKDQQALAQNDGTPKPDQSSSRRSLFGGKKYNNVDPFLELSKPVEQQSGIVKNDSTNTDIPGKPADQFKQVTSSKALADSKNASGKKADYSKIVTWEDFNQMQMEKAQQQQAAQTANLQKPVTTPPQTTPQEEFSIAKMGKPQNPAPEKQSITQVSSSQQMAPPWMDSANPQANCPPANCPPANCPPAPPVGGFENYPPLADINPSPEHLADEYLFDGGDRKQKVYKNDSGLQGLNTEDTVAEYKDHNGQTHYKPTNKVAVYSPKFGAVSSTSDPVVQENIDKVLATHDGIKTGGIDSKEGVITRQQNEKLNMDQVRSGPGGLEHLQEFGDVTKNQAATGHIKLSNPYMERNNQVLVQNRLQQAPTVLNTVLAAQLWTRVLNPVIVARDQQANEIYSRFREQELVGTEERKAPGNLVITKHADKIQAHEGDVITFQIEFENTGDMPLTDVRIIDNLTPRLQFVQGSGTCSLAGQLDIQDNGEGSLILRWELTEPLKPHTKGVVSFKTRVQ